MQRKITKIVCLSGTGFEFHLLDTTAVACDYTNATIEIFLWVEVFGIFKSMARQTEVLDAVETEDEVVACRPITPHQIPALTE